ncbi:MAG: hypothetical protein WB762_35705 [Candidatus Sulfotelmatobacter sp.]
MAGDIPSRPHYEYDIPTAVTFLIAGLGLGSILTLLFASRFEKAMLMPSGATQRVTQ